jgi:hypothetical protein
MAAKEGAKKATKALKGFAERKQESASELSDNPKPTLKKIRKPE